MYIYLSGAPYDITQLDDNITGVKPIFLLVTPTTFKCLFCSIVFSHLTNIKYKKESNQTDGCADYRQSWAITIWAPTWQNQQMTVRPAKTDQPWHLPSEDRSARASAQSDQSSLCAQWVAKDPSFLHADSEDSWSNWADAKADLSLRWAHTHFVGFVMSRLIWANIAVPGLSYTRDISTHHRSRWITLRAKVAADSDN